MSRKAFSRELTFILNEVTTRVGQRLRGTVSGDWKACVPVFWATRELGWSVLLEPVKAELGSRDGMRAWTYDGHFGCDSNGKILRDSEQEPEADLDAEA